MMWRDVYKRQPLCHELKLPQTAFDILMFLANNPEYKTARDIAVSYTHLATPNVTCKDTSDAKGTAAEAAVSDAAVKAVISARDITVNVKDNDCLLYTSLSTIWLRLIFLLRIWSRTSME